MGMVVSLLCWGLGVCKGSHQKCLTGIAFVPQEHTRELAYEIQNVNLQAL